MDYATEEEGLKIQIETLEQKLKPLNDRLRDLRLKKQEAVGEKIKLCHAGKDSFNPDELIFSAYSRCMCGSGVAYPKEIGMRGMWECGDVLLGKAIAKGQPGSKSHDGPWPFAFFEIKSENQPSANGATTRPV